MWTKTVVYNHPYRGDELLSQKNPDNPLVLPHWIWGNSFSNAHSNSCSKAAPSRISNFAKQYNTILSTILNKKFENLFSNSHSISCIRAAPSQIGTFAFRLPNDNFWIVAEGILRIRRFFDIGFINPSQNSFVLPHIPLSRLLSPTHSIMILESWTIIKLDKAIQSLTVSSNQNFLSSNLSYPYIYIKRNRGVYTTLRRN